MITETCGKAISPSLIKSLNYCRYRFYLKMNGFFLPETSIVQSINQISFLLRELEIELFYYLIEKYSHKISIEQYLRAVKKQLQRYRNRINRHYFSPENYLTYHEYRWYSIEALTNNNIIFYLYPLFVHKKLLTSSSSLGRLIGIPDIVSYYPDSSDTNSIIIEEIRLLNTPWNTQESNELQFGLYSLLLKNMGFSPKYYRITFLKDLVITEKKITNQLLDRTVSSIKSLLINESSVDEFNECNFTPTNPKCVWCEFYLLCKNTINEE